MKYYLLLIFVLLWKIPNGTLFIAHTNFSSFIIEYWTWLVRNFPHKEAKENQSTF